MLRMVTRENPVVLNEAGYIWIANAVVEELTGGRPGPVSPQLLAAIRKKNELFFHRWRPANETYLFGFRKHEQGNNAVEIAQFDRLIEKAESEIASLLKSQ